MGESYERAYQNMVRVQQLTELEETIDYSLAFQLAQGSVSERAALTRYMGTRVLTEHGLTRPLPPGPPA